ncbi:MAG: hypothetical protein Alpg2KO_32780 [Alphaproteobacteria bacterium]
MKIGGTPFKAEYVSEFLMALSRLPAAVDNVQRQPKRIAWAGQCPAGQAFNEAERALQDWRNGGEADLLETAAGHYQRAHDLAEERTLPLHSAKAIEHLAELRLTQAKALPQQGGDPAQLAVGKKLAHQAIDMYRAAEQPGNMGQVAQKAGVAIMENIRTTRTHKGYPAEAELKADAEAFFSIVTEAYRLAQGPKIDGALRVDQGQYGVSDSTPLGTDNVQDCISAILHNPETGVAAVAHIDGGTRPDSLQSFLNSVPPRKDGASLDLRLIGAKPWNNGQRNMEVLWKALEGQNVNVSAATVQQRFQGTCYVVDPKTGTVTAGYPGVEPKHGDLANARALISSDYPLSCAFDTRQPGGGKPVPFDRPMLNNLDMRYPTDSLFETFATIESRYGGMGSAAAVWSYETVRMRRQVNDARKGLHQAINKRLDAFEDQGIKVAAVARMVAREIVLRVPLYVGASADSANQGVADEIVARAYPITDKAVQVKAAATDGMTLPIGTQPDVPATMTPPKPANDAGTPPRP